MSAMVFAAFQLGLVYSLLPGPILITSSQCVITGGWRQGCWFLLGVTLADAIYIAIIHWGLSNLLTDNQLINLTLWILGGAWLIKIGFDAMRLPFDGQYTKNVPLLARNFGSEIVNGLCVNLLNPLTIVGWIALGANFVTLWDSSVSVSDEDSLLILLTILVGILTWQLLVVGLVGVFRQQIHQRLLKSLSRMGGIGLILYGAGAWVSAVRLIVQV
jgi:threonine/homoserine/homoserine lactone efflux protein